jgi:ABC-type sugar transport system ATPase subunit
MSGKSVKSKEKQNSIKANSWSLKAKGLCKTFGKIDALKSVDFDVKPGEIHAIIGENGAGKSTLLRCLYGDIHPSSGKILVNNKEIKMSKPVEAKGHGIAMINQEPLVFNDLEILENIYMGHLKQKKNKMVDGKRMKNEAVKLLEDLGLDIELKGKMGNLALAEQQMIEIAAALSSDAKIIFMDEPTASLTPNEVDNLFKLIKQLKSSGKSIVYISHRLDEIKKIADRVTILRDGNLVGEFKISSISVDEMISHMIGGTIDKFIIKEKNKIAVDPHFEVKNLSSEGAFSDVSFDVRKGEIFGIAGLMGAGRTEIAQAIFGILKKSQGKVILDGKELKIKTPSDAIKNKIALVPEDRQGLGIFLKKEIAFNTTFAAPWEITKKLNFIDKKNEKELTIEYTNKLKTKLADIYQNVNNLSGGNQQKVSFVKWLLTKPEVLILDEPTRGIDVGAKQEVYRIINELAKQGKCIIMISSELVEILTLCDRVMVMYEGKQTAVLDRDDINEVNVLTAAHGYATAKEGA